MATTPAKIEFAKEIRKYLLSKDGKGSFDFWRSGPVPAGRHEDAMGRPRGISAGASILARWMLASRASACE
jgi:hypothetical protein